MKEEILSEKMWEWILSRFPQFLELYQRRRKNFDEIIGDKLYLSFKELLLSDPQISRYKWTRIAKSEQGEQIIDIINQIAQNFLLNFYINFSKITRAEKFDINNGLSSKIMYRMRTLFNKNFKILKDQLLESETFEYTAKIPLFRFYSKFNEIILDDQTSIRQMTQEEKDLQLNNLPRHWGFYSKDDPFLNLENLFVLEVKFSFRKFLKGEDLNYNPLIPFYQIPGEIDIIYCFFLLYFSGPMVATFTIGDSFYLDYPPFIQSYLGMKEPLLDRYPLPQSFLSIDTVEDKNRLVQIWQDKFDSFQSYFQKDTQNDIISYAFDTLKDKSLISNVNMKVFLLISTFEGLFYTKIKDAKGKWEPCLVNFLKVSQKDKKEWVFNAKKMSDEDIRDFIEICFKLRNNIAHPEGVDDIPSKPALIFRTLSDTLNPQELNQLKQWIITYFPLFIKFALEIFFKKGFKTKEQWYYFLKE